MIGSFEIKITQTSRSLILSETGGCIIRFGSNSKQVMLMIAYLFEFRQDELKKTAKHK